MTQSRLIDRVAFITGAARGQAKLVTSQAISVDQGSTQF